MEFYGLIGEKLGHSISPQIHNMAFNMLGIEGAYKLFEIPKDRISSLGESIKTLSIKGVNVTIPYKQEVQGQLDFISDEAKSIGAVNTIALKDGKLYGYNTDYYGFGMMLEHNNIETKDKVAVVLGNGGAAKAVNAYLLDSGVKKLYLVSRNKNVDNDNTRINLIDYDDLSKLDGGDILINTTPLGMYPKVGVSPVSEDIINKFYNIVDIIYNPEETEFIRLGRKLDKVTCSGLYMLVGQAIKSEEIWQDKKIDKDIIDKIFVEMSKLFK